MVAVGKQKRNNFTLMTVFNIKVIMLDNAMAPARAPPPLLLHTHTHTHTHTHPKDWKACKVGFDRVVWQQQWQPELRTGWLHMFRA